MEETRKKVSKRKRTRLRFSYCSIFALMMGFMPQIAIGQGSIFGQVSNADLSVPADGEMLFFGFLDNTDEEIRIESSVGAGYESGNWFDDFQNYLTESAGNPYRYYFQNSTNQEGAVLQKLIPSNSFQQENISLSPVSWPARPTGISAALDTSGAVIVSWDMVSAYTYHVYRRLNEGGGSFFRLDNPSGALSDRGVSSNMFVDSAVQNDVSYDYVIIAEDDFGDYSIHSEIVTVLAPVGCCVLAGDASGDGIVNIGDVTQLIRWIFFFDPLPVCNDQADANNDARVNIGDLTYLIAWIFRGGPEPVCGTTGS